MTAETVNIQMLSQNGLRSKILGLQKSHTVSSEIATMLSFVAAILLSCEVESRQGTIFQMLSIVQTNFSSVVSSVVFFASMFQISWH